MRVVLDARSVGAKSSGLSHHGRNLVRFLAELDRENEYVVVRRPCDEEPIVEQANFREILIDYDIASLRNSLFPLSAINKLDVDVFHSLHHFFPRGLRARKKVVTLHDLMWVENPYLSHPNPWQAAGIHFYASQAFRSTLTRADHIIAISEVTRSNALRRYPIDPARITVVHHAANPSPDTRGDPQGRLLPGTLGGRRFILMVGNTRPNKNISRILTAFARLRSGFPDVKLVLVGRGDRINQLKLHAQKLGLESDMEYLGSVDDPTLESLYAQAEFLAFPSLFEGFGIPVLEAMQAGCPVLTSASSPMMEVAGDAAVSVDPTSVDSIAQGMKTLLSCPNLCEELRIRGKARASTFEWRDAARKTLEIYRSVAASSSRKAGSEDGSTLGHRARITVSPFYESITWFLRGFANAERDLLHITNPNHADQPRRTT